MSRFIYVYGMTCSGKSSFANSYANLGYHIIHMDDLVNNNFDVWPKGIYESSSNLLTCGRDK